MRGRRRGLRRGWLRVLSCDAVVGSVAVAEAYRKSKLHEKEFSALLLKICRHEWQS